MQPHAVPGFQALNKLDKLVIMHAKESNDQWQWSGAVGHLCVGVESAGEDTNTIYSLEETLLLQAPSFISNVMYNSLDSTNNIIRNIKSPDILGVYDLCNYTIRTLKRRFSVSFFCKNV